MPELDAAYYDRMKDGKEGPDDPKPRGSESVRARKLAIREGRLTATARDEADVPRVVQEAPAPVVEAPTPTMSAEAEVEVGGVNQATPEA